MMTEAGPDVRPLGPLLYFRGTDGARAKMVAIVAAGIGQPPPQIVASGRPARPEPILSCDGTVVHRYAFELPCGREAAYTCDGERHQVATDYRGDLRLAFASCNGRERGDLGRSGAERNAMWRRLIAEHSRAPFHLLLQGGDQIYADEVTEAHPLSAGWPLEVADRLAPAEREALAARLREGFVERYLATFSQPEYARLAAQVPTLAMWDDHDICDGWGSLPERTLRSDVGAALFAAARETFLAFQIGEASDGGDGGGLGWAVDLPGLRIAAPDLRSERTPSRIMGEHGWRRLQQTLADPPERLLLMSSVPALGPRLSLIERLIDATRLGRKYSDDLRDQWQSRAHRDEWRRLLSALVAVRESGTDVTVVSGEIHLATRATMATASGDVHQLVASGIAHPAPPRGYARALGTLARLGEAPLRAHPIRLHPLPGQRGIYAAERNFLILERRRDRWSASWHLEDSGATEPLPI